MTERQRRRAIEAAYESLAPAVLGYFRSHRMRDPEALTGDVFVAVTQRFDTFEGDAAALRRWVFTIAHHRRVDEIRRSRVRDASAAESAEVAHVDPVPFDVDLVDALARLTEDQREVVVLRFVVDLGIDTIADLTGRSPGSVKMLQSRGLAALGDLLAGGSDDESGSDDGHAGGHPDGHAEKSPPLT